MAIIARDSGGGDFAPAPEGTHFAVCCDVVDQGEQESQWGKRHRVQLRWQLHDGSGVRDDGKPWLVVKSFTLSLHEKSSLRPFLEAWRGKRFTADELKDGFDLERLLAVCCQLQIMQDAGKDGRVYANVHNVMPYPRGMERFPVRDYLRVKDRNDPTPDEVEEAF